MTEPDYINLTVDQIYPGCATVQELYDRAEGTILPKYSSVQFMGNMYNTLLRDHTLTERQIKLFFLELVKIIMTHRLDMPERDANLFQGQKRSKYAQDYNNQFTMGLDYLRAGEYHTQLILFLNQILDKTMNLEHILEGTPATETEKLFLFPEDVRNRLHNQIPRVTNVEFLRLKVVYDSVNNRYFFALFDPRIDWKRFTSIYPNYKTVGNKEQLVQKIAEDPTFLKNHKPVETSAQRHRFDQIQGRVLSGASNLYYGNPKGELGHLDIMSYYGQQHTFDKVPILDPATGAADIRLSIPYWRNMHYAYQSEVPISLKKISISIPELGLQKGNDVSLGIKRQGNYYDDQAIYPHVFPTTDEVERNKKYYIDELIKTKKPYYEDIHLSEEQLNKNLNDINRIRSYLRKRIQYFENIDKADIFYIPDRKNEFKRQLELYKKYYAFIETILSINTPDIIRKKAELLTNLTVLSNRVGVGVDRTTGTRHPLEDLYSGTFLKGVDQYIQEQEANFGNKPRLEVTTYEKCKNVYTGLDILKESIKQDIQGCEQEIHSNLNILLNYNLHDYFIQFFLKRTRTYVSDINSDFETNPEYKTHLSKLLEKAYYSSVISTSYYMTRFIQSTIQFNTDILKKSTNDFLPENIANVIIEIFNNFDNKEYTLINYGEKYESLTKTGSEIQIIPYKFRKACFYINFLYRVRELRKEFSKEQQTDKTVLQNKYDTDKQKKLSLIASGSLIKDWLADETSTDQKKKQAAKEGLKQISTETKRKVQDILDEHKRLNESIQTELDAKEGSKHEMLDKILTFIIPKVTFSSYFPINNKDKTMKFYKKDFENLNTILNKFLMVSKGVISTTPNQINLEDSFFGNMTGSLNKWLNTQEPGKVLDESKPIVETMLSTINPKLGEYNGLFFCTAKSKAGKPVFRVTITKTKTIDEACGAERLNETQLKRIGKIVFDPGENVTVSSYKTVSNTNSNSGNSFNTSNPTETNSNSVVPSGGKRRVKRCTRKARRQKKRTRKTRKD